MQGLKMLLVCLVFLSVFGSVHSQDATEFVVNVEDGVLSIAEHAVENYVDTCELAGTCQQQNCSRWICHPSESSQDKFSCGTISNVSNICDIKGAAGAGSTSIQANYGRGYVRTPPIASTPYGDSLGNIFGDSICAQRGLDSTFMVVNNGIPTSDGYFPNLYFGGADGTFRFYPGREVTENCTGYDPRIRPWYTGATSVVKDLIVLVDTGYYMVNDIGFIDGVAPLELATNLTYQLLGTLTEGDRCTLVPFNATTSSRIPVPDGQSASVLSNTAFNGDSSQNAQSSDFTAAFQEASSVFRSGSPPDALKIVVLLTDFQDDDNPSIEVNVTVESLESEESRLFVYDLGLKDRAAWSSLACQVGGYFEQLNRTLVQTNPLSSMNSYYNFLARSRVSANNGTVIPFWQKPYLDASGLGLVVTVSYPAMSADGLELIGVAGIDIQVDGLSSVLVDGIQNFVEANRSASLDISTFPPGAELNCTAVYNSGKPNSCNATTIAYQPFCGGEIAPASQQTLENLLCYGVCRPTPDHPNLILWIALGGTGGVSVLLLLLVLLVLKIWFLRRRRKRKGRRDDRMLSFINYSYKELWRATNKFNSKNVIGKGAFGVVYRGVLRNEKVAVKHLKRPADRAEDFQAEMKILGLARHPNLVELKGTCFQPTECFLVYELVDGGDLYRCLWPETQEDVDREFLTWNDRKEIATGTARGLDYLHHGLLNNEQVFHLDIKPRNILLERNRYPKIADFGISKIYEPGYTLRVAPVTAGTPGYIAPEVMEGAKPSSKLDSFSYGMLLLHLVTGRKIDDTSARPSLRHWAREHAANAEILVDKGLIQTVQLGSRADLMHNCKQMVALALLCLSEDSDKRPEMRAIIDRLDSLRPVFDREVSDDDHYSEKSYDTIDPIHSNSIGLITKKHGPKIIRSSSNSRALTGSSFSFATAPV